MMSQYDERVERQRLKLKAEEWAKGVKCGARVKVVSLFYFIFGHVICCIEISLPL